MAEPFTAQLNSAVPPSSYFPPTGVLPQRSSSGSETDDSQRISGSPVSLDHHMNVVVNDERRFHPGVLAGSGPETEHITSDYPGFMHAAFQNYKMDGPVHRDTLRSESDSSDRSISPAIWNSNGIPRAPPSHMNDLAPRARDYDDFHTFSSGDEIDLLSGPETARNSVAAPFVQNDLTGVPPLGSTGLAFPQSSFIPNNFMKAPGAFDRAPARNPISEAPPPSSPLDPRTAGPTTLEFVPRRDDSSPTSSLQNSAVPSSGRAPSMSVGSSASTRSFLSHYDSNPSLRGVPSFQNYDEQILSGVGGANGSGMAGGARHPLLQPPAPNGIEPRQSLSRASSRSMSMNATGPVYDRPPSSFDQKPQPPENSFDAQLKASPLFNMWAERLMRLELSTKDIRREVGDLQQKIAILERVVADGGRAGPHQSPGVQEELRMLTQRVNAVTSSLGQLLTLQTQNQLQNLALGSSSGPNRGAEPLQPLPGNTFSGAGQHGVGMGNQNSANSVTPQGSLGSLGAGQPLASMSPSHILPNRPDANLNQPGQRNQLPPRAPSLLPLGGPPRTWSVGNAEMMGRRDSEVGLGQANPMLRDKRKMSLAVGRRDSTISITDDAGNARGDGGGVISKWEHLPLLPELLRSISKYGIGPPNKIQQRALPFLLRGSDIIAQAPPTQERIAAYIIPAIHMTLTTLNGNLSNRGPLVVIISTTVDQATQAQRMIRDLGGPIGIRSALGVGTGGDIIQELRLLQQNMPHILCGTPQKLHALFTSPGGLFGGEVRFLVLDEVDQLIARNLHEFVFNIVKLFPSPRAKPPSSIAPGGSTNTPAVGTPGSNFNPFDAPTTNGRPPSPSGSVRRQSILPSNPPLVPQGTGSSISSTAERQTALFSNTVPQDVLNLANSIQLREPVRVLVRRDGNVTQTDPSTSARGLRQFYLYLAFTAAGRAGLDAKQSDPTTPAGVIGSGRGPSSAETAQAREWKLDALADLFDDIEISHAIVHVGGLNALESVIYKLVSRGFEAVPLHNDMNAGAKLAALNKFKGSTAHVGRPPIMRVLVVYDVSVKPPDVQQIPLVINYDLPKAVEEYSHRVSPAVSTNYSRAGVVINFVTAAGGDVEMLRSIECFYKIKCPEVPMSLRDVI
ncbi:hypothetical protein DL93DRAFT_2163107 [Clavulina sp. PMI_390]|nr:hypothetical protein DL93DRAFT_2163107 [Clavulina sp. PMI_390]